MSPNSPLKQQLLKKKYNPTTEEELLLKQWQLEDLFTFNENSERPFFTIDTPPPYTNASWHMGGAIHYSQIDMIARTMRMKGYEVLFPMGLDRNGLPIEIQTEKENMVRMHEVGREAFLLMCKGLLDRYGDQILGLARSLGLSCNSFEWSKVYKTDEKQYRALTQATFIQAWKAGLVYEDDRPNNWDPLLQTTVADAEIVYKDGFHSLYHVVFSVSETREDLIIATTRPELISAIGVVIFHPSDARYHHLEGKKAKVPLWNIEVPILAHPQADPSFGSGIMMVCSFGDLADLRIYRELGLTPKYVIGPDGRLSSQAGTKYQGMTVLKAREAIVTDLKEKRLIVSESKVPFQQPVSDRSGAPIEFIGMPEFYLQQETLVKKLEEYAKNLTFFPEQARLMWISWLNSISMDWPITRRRYYGTEVPLWYCEQCGKEIVPEPGPYYQPWKNPPPIETCPNCGSKKFKGDERILDTWMDSSISAYYIHKYPQNQLASEDLLETLMGRKDYVVDIRPQGKDIVRTWLHYSMLRGEMIFGKPMFNLAWISGHVLDKNGEKMSKSKGNVTLPEPLIQQHGADALRYYGTLAASHGSDIRFDLGKFLGTKKFLNKLYHIARFIANFPIPTKPVELEMTDRWILGELSKSIQRCFDGGYNELNFQKPALELTHFVREIFAPHYLELVKSRAYNREGRFSTQENTSAVWTLYRCLENILRTFAPIIPFLTDHLYRSIFGSSVHLTEFPSLDDLQPGNDRLTQSLLTFNSDIWKAKQSKGKSLRDEIFINQLPEILEPLSVDLLTMHHITFGLDLSGGSHVDERLTTEKLGLEVGFLNGDGDPDTRNS